MKLGVIFAALIGVVYLQADVNIVTADHKPPKELRNRRQAEATSPLFPIIDGMGQPQYDMDGSLKVAPGQTDEYGQLILDNKGYPKLKFGCASKLPGIVVSTTKDNRLPLKHGVWTVEYRAAKPGEGVARGYQGYSYTAPSRAYKRRKK